MAGLIVICVFILLVLVVGVAMLAELVAVQRRAIEVRAQQRIRDLERETIHRLLVAAADARLREPKC